ncbi:hypothetical protein ACFWAP_14385 [Streptomyces goshikiensis]|uniref:hypothetical protein n=1 Tax=Streptomyces goshikiensis TaxID=1942 RepID=UPI003668CAFA
MAGGPLVKRLLFTAPMGGHVWRGMFNTDQWKPTLAAAGVIAERAEGQGTYASAREHGIRVYALMLSRRERTRTAVTHVYLQKLECIDE